MNKTVPLSLEQVRANFEQWRSTRENSKAKIPQALWDQVYPLTQFHQPSMLCKTLRISGSQYHQHKPGAQPKATFVEVRMQKSPTKTPVTRQAPTQEAQPLDVELIRSDGARLCIKQLDHSGVSGLINAFLG